MNSPDLVRQEVIRLMGKMREQMGFERLREGAGKIWLFQVRDLFTNREALGLNLGSLCVGGGGELRWK
jgi:hypothetical protein